MKEEDTTPWGRRPRQKEQPLIYGTILMIYCRREVTAHYHHNDMVERKLTTHSHLDQELLMVVVRNKKSINRNSYFIVRDHIFLVYKNYSYDLLNQHNYHPP
jgi:hypothetical protein